MKALYLGFLFVLYLIFLLLFVVLENNFNNCVLQLINNDSNRTSKHFFAKQEACFRGRSGLNAPPSPVHM